jgi:hypothetical protein
LSPWQRSLICLFCPEVNIIKRFFFETYAAAKKAGAFFPCHFFQDNLTFAGDAKTLCGYTL